MKLRGIDLIVVWVALMGGNVVGYFVRGRLTADFYEQIARTGFDMAFAFIALYVMIRWLSK